MHVHDTFFWDTMSYIDGLMQDCGTSSANALEVPNSCTKLVIRHGFCVKPALGMLEYSRVQSLIVE